jgi:hypothetical protein
MTCAQVYARLRQQSHNNCTGRGVGGARAMGRAAWQPPNFAHQRCRNNQLTKMMV